MKKFIIKADILVPAKVEFEILAKDEIEAEKYFNNFSRLRMSKHPILILPKMKVLKFSILDAYTQEVKFSKG